MFNWYKMTFFMGFVLVLFVVVVYDKDWKTSDSKIELKILANPPPGYGNRFEELLSLFEKTHPNTKVKLIKAPGDYYVKVQTMMVGNTCADVLLFTGKRINAFKIKKTLLNLMPFMKKENYDLSDFYEVGLKDAQMTDEELFYLPSEGSGTVLFYNKDMFDEAGLKYPDDNWTWKDFKDAAIALRKDIDGDGRIDQTGTSMGYWWGSSLPWIWANGGNLVNKEHTKCLLNKPEAIEAMNFILDLERKHHATSKALGGAESAGTYENFASGRIGMLVSLAYALPSLMNSCKGNSMRWDIAMPPKGKVGRPNRYTSSGWVVWSGTKHPTEAWELLKFLSSQKVMKEYCHDNYYVPARKSLGDSDAFLTRTDTPYSEKILIRSLKGSRPLDNVYALRSISYDFGVALDKARLGLSDIKVEMDQVTAKANAALRGKPAETPKKGNLK
jgi:multiple sugar transport system substrate-binding protein